MLQVLRSRSLGIFPSRSSLQQENYVSLGQAVDCSVHSVESCDTCAPLLHHYYQRILILRSMTTLVHVLEKMSVAFEDVQLLLTCTPTLSADLGSLEDFGERP